MLIHKQNVKNENKNVNFSAYLKYCSLGTNISNPMKIT